MHTKNLEKQLQELQNQDSNESKQKYQIAKSKIESLSSTHYEKL